MTTRRLILLCSLGLMAGFVGSAVAQEHAKAEKAANTNPAESTRLSNSAATHEGPSSAAGPKSAIDEKIARLEGEKRSRTNCGRCHQPPHKFPPRVMATAIRHMRVRAMITDEDMRLILRYMTQ